MMKEAVQFDTIGKITKGENKRWYLKVLDDKKETGGFYILESPSMDFKKGFDSWVETQGDIEGYFKESNWEIDWLNKVSSI